MKTKYLGVISLSIVTLLVTASIVMASSKEKAITPVQGEFKFQDFDYLRTSVPNDEEDVVKEGKVEEYIEDKEPDINWESLVNSEQESIILESLIKEREVDLDDPDKVGLDLKKLGVRGAVVVKLPEKEIEGPVETKTLEDYERELDEFLLEEFPDVEAKPLPKEDDSPEVKPVKVDKAPKGNSEKLDLESLEELGQFTITAYDLSFTCCGKPRSDPEFGITKDGTNLIGLSREDAMVVAVDPSVIPLGTKIYLDLPEPYKHFSGVYRAADTGNPSIVTGRKIDLYMGDFGKEDSDPSVWDFGVRTANVYVVE